MPDTTWLVSVMLLKTSVLLWSFWAGCTEGYWAVVPGLSFSGSVGLASRLTVSGSHLSLFPRCKGKT